MNAATRDVFRLGFVSLAFLTVAAVAGCSQSPPQAAKPATAGRASVAVADFDFFSNDKSLSFLQQGVPAMMCTDISQVRALDVLARKTMLAEIRKEQQLAEDGLIDKATAARAGKLLGAKFLLGGAVHVEDTRLRLDAQVIDAETGRVFFSTTVSGSKDEASSLEAQLAEQVAESICGSLGMDLSEGERLAVRGERKGGFDSFALYNKAALAEQAGDREKARLIFKDVMESHADGKKTDTVTDMLRAAASEGRPGSRPNSQGNGTRKARLDEHKAKWQAIDSRAAHDSRWLASPIILSAHAGLAGDFDQERRLLGAYWRRFTKTAAPAEAAAKAKEVAALIRTEEEFFRATVDSGDYNRSVGAYGIGRGDPDGNLHADMGPNLHWPRFSKLWPFDPFLRENMYLVSAAQGAHAEEMKAHFVESLAKHPHDFLGHIINDLSDVVRILDPANWHSRERTYPQHYPLLCGDTFSLRADVISYCTQIPNPPDKLQNDMQNLTYTFLHDLDRLPATMSLEALGHDFLSSVVPALSALAKAAPNREHRDTAQGLLIRFGRQLGVAGKPVGSESPDATTPPSIFGIQISTPTVLIVWHEDEAFGLNQSKQEDLVRKELENLVLALPARMKINAMLALGNILGSSPDKTDEWLLENPQAADGEIKKKLLAAVERDNSSHSSTKGPLTNAVKAALQAPDADRTTVFLIRLRNDSEIQPELDHGLADLNPSVTVHAILSARSAGIENVVRGHRGSTILLESDGDFIFGKVRKRVIDTTTE